MLFPVFSFLAMVCSGDSSTDISTPSLRAQALAARLTLSVSCCLRCGTVRETVLPSHGSYIESCAVT